MRSVPIRYREDSDSDKFVKEISIWVAGTSASSYYILGRVE